MGALGSDIGGESADTVKSDGKARARAYMTLRSEGGGWRSTLSIISGGRASVGNQP